VHAVKDVNLQIRDKEFVVFVGPSGCGKTTTLRMIAGLEAISSGAISIDGQVVNELAPMDRDIAMVFQNYALYPHMSVYDNMAYGLKIAGLSKQAIRERVDVAAEMLELKPYLDRKPRALSGGQRQRVAMGRALVRQPAAFLFDEPLSNLDAKLRVQMRLEIKAMQRKVETTSLYVTHDQVEAMTLADRLVVMNAGHAEQIDTPLNVYRAPATTFVAGFIGSPAMNMMAATVANGSRLELDSGGSVKPRDVKLPDAGRKVLLGIRPEHLAPVQDLNADLKLAVAAVETLGADTLAHGRLASAEGTGGELVARLPGTSAVKPGDVLPLAVEPGMVHLFDRETGKRIEA
jgi:sn-glycerol 3-phosphate transport system ATP-binding protein